MMRSMTGYGSGRSAGGGAQFSVEIHSVNRRQSELVVHLPRELAPLEPRVRDLINSQFARGRLTASVTTQSTGNSASGGDTESLPTPVPVLDLPLARSYHRAMLELQHELGVSGEITIDHILRSPGILRPPAAEEKPAASPEAAWPRVAAALQAALAELLAMREREGAALAKDLGARVEELRRLVGEVRARQPTVITNYRAALRERIDRAGVEIPLDSERLAKEVAIFADRCDISEELTRLESHLEGAAALLIKPEPVGRALDFLGQEIARELNTLGVKGNDLTINQLVLAAKAELEKLREQVQNIE